MGGLDGVETGAVRAPVLSDVIKHPNPGTG